MQSSKDLQKAKDGLEAFAKAYESLHCRIKWLEDRNAHNHTIIKNLKEGRTVDGAHALKDYYSAGEAERTKAVAGMIQHYTGEITEGENALAQAVSALGKVTALAQEVAQKMTKQDS